MAYKVKRCLRNQFHVIIKKIVKMVHRFKDNMIGTESYKRHIKFPLTPGLTSQSIT